VVLLSGAWIGLIASGQPWLLVPLLIAVIVADTW
jgi:hypothetical protein